MIAHGDLGALAIDVEGKVTTPGTGSEVVFSGDSMSLNASVSAAGREVGLLPLTTGTLISLGGADAAGTLGLTNAELGMIISGTLQIGNGTSGTITVSAPITLPAAINVNLISGSDIVLGAGTLNTDGGMLTLAPGSNGAVKPTTSGTDVNVTPAALAFVPGANLAIAINGTTPQSQYSQLSVLGGVNLTGANLVLSGNLTPVAGQTFTIVNNQGTQPIIGTFNGLPEGAVITSFLGSSLSATISYLGGDGNDVVLTVRQPNFVPVPTSTVLSASAATASYGQAVTFTATVMATSTPAGSVEFFDDTTGTDLGAGVLQSSNATAASWTYTTSATQLQATGPSGDNISAIYSPTGNFQGSEGMLTGGERITPLPVTVSGLQANKVYDGTTIGSLNVGSPGVVLMGVISGDNVTLNGTGASATLASAQVGSGIPVTVTGLSIAGAQASDYTLTQPTLTANITPAPLTVVGITVANKVYDGTTAATLNLSGAALAGIISGDSVTLVTSGATGTFANPGPGTNIAVTVSGLALGGAQASDYSLTPPVLTGNISRPNISDGGTGLLSISLGVNQTLAIVSLGSSYTFTSNQTFTAASTADPANQGTAFSGIGTSALTLTSIGLSQYTSGISITDAGANASVTFGDSGGNAYTTNFTVALSNAAAGTISVLGNSNFGTFNLQASTTSDIELRAGVLSSSSGNLTLRGFAGVSVDGGIQITGRGALTVQGGGGNSPQSGNYDGVVVENGWSISGGTGPVVVTGIAGVEANASLVYGVYVKGLLGVLNSAITSSGGNVQVTGVGGGGSFTNGGNYGVFVSSNGVISAGGTGTVTVNGTGGTTEGGNSGVYVADQANPGMAAITSNGGDVHVTGEGGGGATPGAGSGNYGVDIGVGGKISAGGAGNVIVQGTGGAGPVSAGLDVEASITSSGGNVQVIGQGGGSNLDYRDNGVTADGLIIAGGSGRVLVQGTGGSNVGGGNRGVFVVGTISSSGGNVQVTGVAGNGLSNNGSNTGVEIDDSGLVSASGLGSVTVQGTGGASAGMSDDGVTLDGNTPVAPATITSGGGNVSVTGVGGSGPATSISNVGVDVEFDSLVTAGGTGSVTINGTGGATAGGNNYGVGELGQGGDQPYITSNGGNIQVIGQGGGGTGSQSLSLPYISTPLGGTITLVGDSMTFNADSPAIIGSQSVTLAPKTSGTLINLGGVDAPGTLGLTGAMLAYVSAPTLNIGNANSGAIEMSAPITVRAPITSNTPTNVNLTSGSNITFNGGSINTGGGALTLAPGSSGAVKPLTAGTDVSVSPAALAFAPAGANLAIAVNGTTVDTSYNQLSVQGDVNLSGVNLVLSGNLTPVAGQTFTIVNNQGSHPIVGTFNGLPEGAVIPNFLRSPLSAVISYVGGDGNDVVLTVEHATSMAVTASAGTSIYGQPVIFDATVTTNAGIPTGSVEFFDDTTGADLGIGVPQGSGPGTATWAYSTTPTQLQVTPEPHTIRAVYAPTDNFLGSSSTLAGGETITRAPLTVTGITAANKVFDATTTAILNTAGATLAGAFAGDTVSLNTAGASGTFASKNVGNNIPVMVSGVTITGPQAGDYTLIQPTTTANITPATALNPPLPRIGSRSNLEGASGLTPFTFQVSLPVAPSQPITYDVYTTDGSAVSVGTSPNFVAIAPDVNGSNSVGTVSFAPGQVAQTITVNVIAGTMPVSGGNRSFFVSLSNPAMANVALATATATIIPQGTSGGGTGGALPTPRIGNVQTLEGSTGFTPFTFHVSLAVAPAQSVTYDVYTTAGTALGGTNYVSISAGDNNPPHGIGTVTFAPGQVSQTATVYIIAGTIPVSAGSKTFTVSLSDPAHSAVPLATATGTIIPQNAPMPAATPALASLSVVLTSVDQQTPTVAAAEAPAVSVLRSNISSGTTATVSATPLPSQVFQIGTASALNSLLYGNGPGQLAANQLFLDLARGTDTLADFNGLSLFQDNLWDVAAQQPDWLAIPSQFSAPKSRTEFLAGWPNLQSGAQQLGWDPATMDKVFAALGADMDDTGEIQSSPNGTSCRWNHKGPNDIDKKTSSI